MRNSSVRRSAQVHGKMKEVRMTLLEHVVRREEDYVRDRMRQPEVRKRTKGNPKKRWKNCAKVNLTIAGLQEEYPKDKAQ